MPLFTTLLGGKLVIGAFAVGSIALGGTAAVAATGSLPAPLQEQAHTAFGAPAPQHEEDAVAASDTEASDSAETDATDPAETDASDSSGATDPSEVPAPLVAPSVPTVAVPASVHGLCTAFTHGGLPAHSAGYVRLVAAAGGADLTTWCAPHLGTVAHAKVNTETSASDDSGSTTSGHHHARPEVARTTTSESDDQNEQGDEVGHDQQNEHDGQDSASKDSERSQDSGDAGSGDSSRDGSDGSSSD